MWLLILVFVIHFIVCTVLLFAKITGRIKCNTETLVVAFFIPVWGEGMFFCRLRSDRELERERTGLDLRQRSESERYHTDVPDRVFGQSSADVNAADRFSGLEEEKDDDEDVMYQKVSKSIQVDQDEMKEKVVPIEEALVVNDTSTRRELLVDVLYTNPNDYISQLYKAKSNSDTEVVHYAATALAEIQKEFDVAFHDIAMRKTENPGDESIDQEYQRVLEKYIASGLLEGDGLKNQLKLYSDLLGRKLKGDRVNGRWALLNKKAETDLQLEDTDALDEDIALMMSEWPKREGVYRYRLKNAMLKKDRNLIKQVIDEMQENNIFMSVEMRNLTGFWVGE